MGQGLRASWALRGPGLRAGMNCAPTGLGRGPSETYPRPPQPESGRPMMGAHSCGTNPSRAHGDTHTPTRSRENEPIARANPHKVGNAHGRWLPRIPHTPANAHWRHGVPHELLSHSPAQTLSNTSSLTGSHNTNTRARFLSTGSRPFQHPSWNKGPGPPNSPLPAALPRHSKGPGIPASLGPYPRTSALAPAPSPGHEPRPLSPSRRGCSSRGAPLGAPPLAPQPPQPPLPPRPAGRHPGAGAGPRPAGQPLQPLA